MFINIQRIFKVYKYTYKPEYNLTNNTKFIQKDKNSISIEKCIRKLLFSKKHNKINMTIVCDTFSFDQTNDISRE